MTSLTLGMCGAYCMMFFFFTIHICCCWKQHRALRFLFGGTEGDRPTELPGNLSCVLAYRCQSGRDACWQRREGSPLSCPALIKGPDPGVDRLATLLHAQWLGLYVCVCVCKWFILKQDVRVLRIHPYHQPRKLCARLQHTSVTRSKSDMCVCVCVFEIVSAYVLCICLCVQSEPSLVHHCVLVPFLRCSWHVDVLASCVVGLKLSPYWQGGSD